MDERGRILFVGVVTCYLLGRLFGGDASAVEAVVYGLTAAFGLEFVMASWPRSGTVASRPSRRPWNRALSAVDSGVEARRTDVLQGLAAACSSRRCSTSSRASTRPSRSYIFVPGIVVLSRSRARPRRLGDRLARRRRLRLLDAHRVLDAPHRVPLRARGGARRAAPLDHPRRPPRPPERPAAAGDAAVGERAARARLLRPVRARARRPSRCVRGRVPRRLPGLRHAALPRAPSPPAHAAWASCCGSCTCATTSRTTPAASASAHRSGTGSSGPRSAAAHPARSSLRVRGRRLAAPAPTSRRSGRGPPGPCRA